MNKFKVLPSHFFIIQLKKLDIICIEKIYKKLKLLEINPNRNKSLFHKKFNLLRIRLTDSNKEIRIVYTIRNLEVIILFILNRSNNYKDLEKYLKKVQKEFK